MVILRCERNHVGNVICIHAVMAQGHGKHHTTYQREYSLSLNTDNCISVADENIKGIFVCLPAHDRPMHC